MDSYRPLFFSIAALIAWWTLASLSYPAMPVLPEEWLRAAMLGAAIAYLLVTGNSYRRDGHNLSCMFLCSAALIPPAYYLEYWYLASDGAARDPAALDASLAHAVTVYNAFRYFLLLVAFIILAKSFIRNFKNF
ncbi:MAG TPA: hypothetical protein DCR21_01875 [Succinivibrionaceae bacterium]|nr:hypothetical protein [Succinivibrionaceae bacterium]